MNSTEIATKRQQPARSRKVFLPWHAHWWPALMLGLAIAITCVALVLLLWSPWKSHSTSDRRTDPSTLATVEIAGPRLLQVQPDTPLAKKLICADVQKESISAPILTVTGTVVARLPSGEDAAARWDFNTPELAGAYSDWLKATLEVVPAEEHLVTITKLTESMVGAQTKIVERLQKEALEIGTEPRKELLTAEAELVRVKLQGEKDIRDAKLAVTRAKATLDLLERQLRQAGVDPTLLAKASPKTALVVAEVPEARVGLVRLHQECKARFYAYPNHTFGGRVASVAPSLSKERRTQRVFFEVNDPNGRLKPGMFAEIGLGTDPREARLIPADGVLHVGRSDYVLVETRPDEYRITEVKVGETRSNRVEILSELPSGTRVIGGSAILLKPFVVQSLHREETEEKTP